MSDHLVEMNLKQTDPLYHEDLYGVCRKVIKRRRSKILSNLKNLQHNLEEGLYADDPIIDRIQDEIDIRTQNIEFIDEFLSDLEEEDMRAWS